MSDRNQRIKRPAIKPENQSAAPDRTAAPPPERAWLDVDRARSGKPAGMKTGGWRWIDRYVI